MKRRCLRKKASETILVNKFPFQVQLDFWGTRESINYAAILIKADKTSMPHTCRKRLMFYVQNSYISIFVFWFIYFCFLRATGLQVQDRHSSGTETPLSIVNNFQIERTTALFQDLNESRKRKEILKLCPKLNTFKLLKNLGKWASQKYKGIS